MALMLRRQISTFMTRCAPMVVDENGPYFVNNNPRNNERLRIERKQEGWTLEPVRRNFWNKICYRQCSNSISGYVEHSSGVRFVQASSSEPCISRHLSATRDVNAAYNVGRVLAHRCLKAGLMEVHCEINPEELQRSKKMQRFFAGIEEVGIVLKEPAFIPSEPVWEKRRHVKPWLVTEQMALADT